MTEARERAPKDAAPPNKSRITIVVVDVAASEGGALTVLRGFHSAACSSTQYDWVFYVSTPKLPSATNVAIRSYPWTKRSWLHRLLFDYVTAPLRIRREDPAMVFSLQNVAVPARGVRQVVYLHQAIPFSDFRFKLFESPLMWTYQNVISLLIKRGLKQADAVIVQTQWMRNRISRLLAADAGKIHVVSPEIAAHPAKFEATDNNRRRFFYPAAAEPYKNHKVIIGACDVLKSRGRCDLEVAVTVSDHELERLGSEGARPPILATGRLPYDEVRNRYAISVLVFPSKLESFPLPLAEALMARTFILAADTPFAREILNGYRNAFFFAPDDAEALANLMEGIASGRTPYDDAFETSGPTPGNWQDVVKVLVERE